MKIRFQYTQGMSLIWLYFALHEETRERLVALLHPYCQENLHGLAQDTQNGLGVIKVSHVAHGDVECVRSFLEQYCEIFEDSVQSEHSEEEEEACPKTRIFGGVRFES